MKYSPRSKLLAFLLLSSQVIPLMSVEAKRYISESYVASLDDKSVLEGISAGEQFGAALEKGDFNGDGIDDLVVAAPFYSTNDQEWEGRVDIIFGGLGEKSSFYGEKSGDQLGSSVAVGDFNNDGYDDLAMAAYNNYSKVEKLGRVYIVYGGVDMSGQKTDFTLREAETKIVSKGVDDGFGLSLSTVDINGDSFDDLLVGAPFSDTNLINRAGAVYLYLGSVDKLNDYNESVFYGDESHSRFGSSIAAGHLSSQDRVDIVIGAYKADPKGHQDSGAVYYYKNANNLKAVFSVPDHVLYGEQDNEWFGFNLKVGNLNNDLYQDLAISSFPFAKDRDKARVTAFYGGEGFKFQKKAVQLNGKQGEALLGADIELTDLNKDGKDDLVVGAPGINDIGSEEAGSVYALYSSSSVYSSAYEVKNYELDSYIHGESAGDWFGYDIEVLDFNDDGYEDVAVGARYADSDLGISVGKVFVLLGSEDVLGKERAIIEKSDKQINRSEFVNMVIDRFELKEKKKTSLSECLEFTEFCLFNFIAMSSYNDLKLEEEIILYPDVQSDHPYYEEINVATLLGLVNGYTNEFGSPFHPERSISRIQALKVILTAADLVPPKYKFELVASLGSYENLISQKTVFSDVDTKVEHMWWYPRYANFALEKGIIDESKYLRPDDNITVNELEDMINRTLNFINKANEETESRGDS